jgi:hypothetical protein
MPTPGNIYGYPMQPLWTSELHVSVTSGPLIWVMCAAYVFPYSASNCRHAPRVVPSLMVLSEKRCRTKTWVKWATKVEYKKSKSQAITVSTQAKKQK